MRLLVTGANGQLGLEMRKFAPEYFDNGTLFFTDKEDLDICNRETVMAFVKENKIEAIVNCAAYTAVDKAEDDCEACDVLNHQAPGYLAEAAETVGAWLVHVSTDYVFDGTGYRPYTENDITIPATTYGRTKLAGEKAVAEQCSRYVILRTGWLVSEHGNNFVKTMWRLMEERPQVGVVFDQAGTPTYAGNLAEAICRILQKEPVCGIYHYSSEGVCSWYDFAMYIRTHAVQNTCRVIPLHTDEFPTKARRPHYSVLDKSKIKQTYGIDIPHWTEAVQECIEALKEKKYQQKQQRTNNE